MRRRSRTSPDALPLVGLRPEPAGCVQVTSSGPLLFDTSVYIRDLRSRGEGALSARFLRGGAAVWLSAVVLEELFAGASGRGLSAVERLERDFAKLRRVLVPTLADWAAAGRMLAAFGKQFGFAAIAGGRLTNDALIAASAARLEIAVVTANARDFERLASLRPFRWQAAPPDWGDSGRGSARTESL